MIVWNVNSNVFINKDYEPYGIKRDQKIAQLLSDKGIKLLAFKDLVIHEDGTVYDVKSNITGSYATINFIANGVVQINSGGVIGLDVNSVSGTITLTAKKAT